MNKIIYFCSAATVFLITMLFYTWTELIYSFLVFLVIGVFGELYLVNKRSRMVSSILNDEADPDRFLEEIERDLKRIKNKNLNQMLLINKTAGLFFKGRWDEAIDILNAIDINKMPKMFKLLYINNKIANWIALDDIQKADGLLGEYKNLLEQPLKNEYMHYSLLGNRAVLEYKKGNLSGGRQMLEECLDPSRMPLQLASSYFYLALMDIDENNIKEAILKLKKANGLSSKTFLPGLIQPLLEKYDHAQ